MARSKKIISLSEEAREDVSKIKQNLQQADQDVKALAARFKEIKAEMMKTWTTEVNRLFNDCDEEDKVSEWLNPISFEKPIKKTPRAVKDGEIVYSKNGTPLRLISS